ncbi:MAG: PEP-CTERM sorting domain-containing protein [Chlamydiota bacterium]
MKIKQIAVLAVVIAAICISAGASTIDLTFEGIAPYPSNNDVQILNFYNGGTSSVGTSGPNYGISFPDNALLICLNTLSTFCSNTSRGGQGDPNSQLGGLYFLTGSSTYLNDPAGFTTGFSFNYAAPYYGGSIEVYSGLNGTGTLLASLTLPTTTSGPCPNYGAGYCPFFPIGVTFAGTAQSINFGGTANYIVFDDVTFGSPTPGPGPNAPEPSSLAIFGSGIVGLAGLLRRRFKS